VNGLLGRIYKRIVKPFEKSYKISYAQCGEDLIIQFVFEWLKVSNPTYLDIGAHHPTWLSNTYLFYCNGSSGVCVEPDPDCYAVIKGKRNRDICLNVGIGTNDQKYADFFVMTSRTLNTFSREEAERCQNTRNFGKQQIEKVVQIPTRSVDEIMHEHLPNGVNLVSLDVEGLDFEILRTFNFSKFRPEVFCVETIRFQDDGSLRKNQGLLAFMKANGYWVYADTYINTIFVSEQAGTLLR
jgi:FkbM family methyltransferase